MNILRIGILEILICLLSGYFETIDELLYVSIILICNSLLFFYYLLRLRLPVKFFLVLILGFMTRIALMVIDYNFPDLFSLLYGQGRDDIGFIQQAMGLYQYGFGYYPFNAYPYFVAVLFNIFGPYELIGRFVNILFSVFSALVLYKILKLLEIRANICIRVSAFFLFMPWSLFLSSRMLREAMPTFFVVCSVYYFIRWMKNGSFRLFCISVLFVAIGMLFHSGVVGIAVGYLIVYTFYDHQLEKFQFNLKSFLLSICVLILAVGIVIFAGDTPLFWKFGLVNSEDSLQHFSQNWSNNTAGTAYLQWLPVYTDPVGMIWQSPIRAFYFIFSPLPWDIRRFQDIVVLVLDSSIYMYGCYLFLKYKGKMTGEGRAALWALMVSFMITTFIYGLGTFDYGTAIRHRAKFMSLLFIIMAVIKNNFSQTHKYIGK